MKNSISYYIYKSTANYPYDGNLSIGEKLMKNTYIIMDLF